MKRLSRKHLASLVATAAVAGLVAPPGAGSPVLQGQGKGKNKPPKEETVVRALVQLADRDADTLLSDGRVRQDPAIADADLDGFGDLSGPFDGMGGPIVYQDRLVPAASSGFHPDPCTVFDDIDSRGKARARLDADECSITGEGVEGREDVYLDDARTFTVVFDRGTAGGDCACDAFSYLATPGGMLGGADAETTFVENDDGTCSVTPAAGPIVTDSTHNLTGGQQIIAWPFDDLQSQKQKGRKSTQTQPGLTDVHINFRTDRAFEAQPNGWLLHSRGESIANAVDGADPDTWVVTADGDLFDLWLAGEELAQCSDIPMSFQMSFTRFEVSQ